MDVLILYLDKLEVCGKYYLTGILDGLSHSGFAYVVEPKKLFQLSTKQFLPPLIEVQKFKLSVKILDYQLFGPKNKI